MVGWELATSLAEARVGDVQERLRDDAGALHGTKDGGEEAENTVGELLGFARGPAVHTSGPLGGPSADERDERVIRQSEGGGRDPRRELLGVLFGERSPRGEGFVGAGTGWPVPGEDGFPRVDHQLQHSLRI